MTLRKIVIATTCPGKGMAAVTYEDLARNRDLIDHSILPVYEGNDPRSVPIGRVISGELTRRDDGEYALEITVELFGPDISLHSARRSDKKFLISGDPGRSGGLVYPPEFDLPERLGLVRSICSALAVNATRSSGIGSTGVGTSAFTIGLGSVPFGYIRSAIHERFDKDTIRTLRKDIPGLFSPGEGTGSVPLLAINLWVFDQAGRETLVEIIVPRPSAREIRMLIPEGLGDLDRLLPPYYLSRSGPKKIVMSYLGGRYRVLYALEEHGLPLVPRRDMVGM